MNCSLPARFFLFAFALVGCAGDDGQTDIDPQVVYAVLDTQGFLYNQNLIGLPVGPQDLTVDCPLGGTARIFGATAGEGGTSLDLTFAYDGCENAGTGYSAALTGDVSWSGSFRSTGYKALGTRSDSLRVVGAFDAGGDVDETCALSVTDRGEDGETSTVTGEWCGRSVSF